MEVERGVPGCLVGSGTCLGRGCWWVGLDHQGGHQSGAVQQTVIKPGAGFPGVQWLGRHTFTGGLRVQSWLGNWLEGARDP